LSVKAAGVGAGVGVGAWVAVGLADGLAVALDEGDALGDGDAMTAAIEAALDGGVPELAHAETSRPRATRPVSERRTNIVQDPLRIDDGVDMLADPTADATSRIRVRAPTGYTGLSDG
jgi:hypothetical protein